jgi:hypothetical protein
MRSVTIRATAVEGVRSFAVREERSIPAWRRRALFPETEGVSERFRGAAVDMTGRLIVR